MGKPEVRMRTVSIVETDDGWRLGWGSGDFEDHGTAAEALGAVKEMARVLADGGISTVFAVEWTVYTRVGRDVVRAISES